jgi:subtilase family serine protease
VEHRTSQETAGSNDELSQGKKSWTARVVLLLSSVMMTVLALVGMAVTKPSSTGLVSLPQSVAPQVASAKLIGATSNSQKLSLAVSLHSRNQAGLQDYAQQVSQPKSKLFHQYLTPAQFASVFGADPASLNAVERYMQSNGLHLDNAQSGGLFLTFSGTVSQVDAAFHTQINNYKAADGRSVYANATALQIPSALAPSIMDVAGTENIRVEHSSLQRSAKQAKAVAGHTSITCPTISSTNYTAAGAGYTYSGVLPPEIAKQYSMNNTTNPGNNVWVAMIENDGFSTEDLYQFANCSGSGISSDIATAIRHSAGTSYSDSDLIITRHPGMSSAFTPGSNAEAVEAELETLLGLVPNLKHLAVVETEPTAEGTQLALADIANNNGAQVVGDSWGMCESDLGFSNAQAEEQLFMQMTLQGQSVFAATGDNGLYACYGDGVNFHEKGFAVQDPASDPFVTAVGGNETIVSNNSGTGVENGEQPWIDTTNKLGGGGGISLFWPAMSWKTSADAVFATNPATAPLQVGIQGTYNNGSTPARVVPDVSAAADPDNSSVAVYCSVGDCTSGATIFDEVGGTSIANATWVAAAAQAVQASVPTPATQVGGRLGVIAPALFAAYQADTISDTQVLTVYCDYASILDHPVGFPATRYFTACGGGHHPILNNPGLTIAGTGFTGVTFLASDGFQQLPSSGTYSAGLGFSIASESVGNSRSGYNALTGLGSPIVGDTTGGTAELAQYLSAQSRQGIARMYMVAQASSDDTYWIGSYAINPYVQNLPTYTQWFKLGSTIFSGAPVIVDDGIVGGTASNLYIFGPTLYSTTGIAEIKWDLTKNIGTTVSTSITALPASGACQSVSAFTDAETVHAPTGTNYGIYCVTSDGKLFVNKITASTGVFGAATWTALTGAGALSAAPQVASDGNSGTAHDPNYALIYQTPGSNNVKYLYVPGAGAGAFATLTSTIVLGSASILNTTCNSTPSLAYMPQLSAYAASCIASDTHNMWGNVYNPLRSSDHQWNMWELLGQPSPSVTFNPGSVVAVDRIVNDPGYNLVFYIAEGSDGGMYLDIANPDTTSTVGDFGGWTNVSLPGIFNGNAGADFANA